MMCSTALLALPLLMMRPAPLDVAEETSSNATGDIATQMYRKR